MHHCISASLEGEGEGKQMMEMYEAVSSSEITTQNGSSKKLGTKYELCLCFTEYLETKFNSIYTY